MNLVSKIVSIGKEEIIVINKSKCYLNMISLIERNHPELLSYFKQDTTPHNYDTGFVIARHMHPVFGYALLVIKLHSGRVFIISEDGIMKKKDFEKKTRTSPSKGR